MSSQARQKPKRRDVARVERELHEAWLRTLPDEAELASLPIEPAGDELPSAGSRPQAAFVDRRGRCYLFKVAPEEHIAAEVLAARVRRLGRRLHVPVVRRTVLVSGQSLVGMLQPRIEVVGELPKDPMDWSALQCEALLREHPWEWLLANLDTHIDQYVLVGPDRLPLNIDWDHSLVDLATTELTRFNRRSPTVIPVRNLLYAEYVAGRLSLGFYGMQLEARRIARLPFGAIEALLHRWARDVEADDAERRGVIEAMRRRHANIASDFDRLVHELHDERRGAAGRRPWSRRTADHFRDAWQRLALLVLHDHVVRPALTLRRRLAGRTMR